MMADSIIVTGQRIAARAMESASPAMVASEENLGDLKLYRVPEPVTVTAKGQKQVAFLAKEGVTGRFIYVQDCDFNAIRDDALQPARIMFATENEARRGLGVALPNGGLTLYEPSSEGAQLVAETRLRDFAEGEDVELELIESAQVFAGCALAAGTGVDERERVVRTFSAEASNANPVPVTVRFRLGSSSQWQPERVRGARLKDGQWIVEQRLPANSRRTFTWTVRRGAT